MNLKLNYELTLDDFKSTTRIPPIAFLIVLFAPLINFYLDFQEVGLFGITLVNIIAYFVPVIIAYPILLWVTKKQVTNRSKLSIGTYQVEFDADKVVTQFPYGTITNSWYLYRKIKVTKYHIILYLKPSPMYTVIPKRAFASQDEVNSFVFMAKERIHYANQAKQTLHLET